MTCITEISLQYDREAPIGFTMPVSTSLAVALTTFNEVMCLSYKIKSSVSLPEIGELDFTNSPDKGEEYVAQTRCVYDTMYTLHWRKSPLGDLSEIETIYNSLFYLITHTDDDDTNL